MSGVQAEEVTINLAGSHIMGFNGQAIVAVAGRDREITADDVRRAIDSACAIQLPAGREIVDRLPQEFIVDDQDGINDSGRHDRRPAGCQSHIVTSPVTARQNAINAVNRAGLIVADMILEQLAAAEATLTDDDKEYGSALVDIGAETTGLCVYQRGAVQHTAVFPLAEHTSLMTLRLAYVLRFRKLNGSSEPLVVLRALRSPTISAARWSRCHRSAAARRDNCRDRFSATSCSRAPKKF